MCVLQTHNYTETLYICIDSKTKNSIHLKTRIYRNYVTPIKIIRIAQASLSIYICVCVCVCVYGCHAENPTLPMLFSG